jgi:hypothetical protein
LQKYPSNLTQAQGMKMDKKLIKFIQKQQKKKKDMTKMSIVSPVFDKNDAFQAPSILKSSKRE